MKEIIELLRTKDNQVVSARLLPMADRHLDDFEAFWRPRLQNTSEEDRHWDWIKKQRITNVSPSYERYALECDHITQGLMLLEIDRHRSRIDPGKSLVYLDYFATSPWNRSSLKNPPDYRGVGTALFTLALERSVALEYKGRVGLHALPRAEGFYHQLKMVDFGCDASKQNLKYFEVSVDRATEILESFQ